MYRRVKRKEFIPIILTEEQQDILSDACITAREDLVKRCKRKCSICPDQRECDILAELELALKGE